MKQLSILLFVAASVFGQSWPTTVATSNQLLRAADNASTTLTAVVDPTTLSLPVASSGNFVADSIVVIGTEQIKICSVSTGTLTACAGGRGFGGTLASSHAVNSAVKNNIVAAYHNGVAGEVTAVEQWLANRSSKVVAADDYPGVDCGAKINAAYAALPSSGGVILTLNACSFATTINFGTVNKPVILRGVGNGSELTYTGSAGTAIVLNNGIKFDMTSRLEDIVLTGPGHGTSTTGVIIGGSNGCVGCSIEHSVIESFGTNLLFQSNEWLSRVAQSMIRDGGTNVLLPSGTIQAGENIQFDHVTFADAPAPHTNSVWVQGGGQEVDFTDCSFDQAQLRIGNGAVSASQVNIKGTHFENPNFAVPGSVQYDYLTVDNHNGNYVRLTDSYFLQDDTVSTQPRFAYFGGGKIVIMGIGMYSPIPMTSFATVDNAVNIDLFSFNDLSGSLLGNLLGGTTTGFVMSMPGANTATTIARNMVYKPGDTVGGAAFDFKGNVRSSDQIVALAATGTAPFVVNSTTPVNNLFAQPATYAADGTQQVGKVHIVQGTIGLAGDGTMTINLSGGAQFTNASSYSCVVNDISTTAAANATQASGSQFVLHGTALDNVSYVCIGN